MDEYVVIPSPEHGTRNLLLKKFLVAALIGMTYSTENAGHLAYKIAAHSLRDGALLWTTNVISIRPERLLYANGKIYFANDDYLIQCNDSRTGAWLWNAKLGAEVRDQRRPVISVNQTVLIAAKPQGLWALHPLTGKILWQRDMEIHSRPAGPVIDSTKVYLSSPSEFMAIQLRDGEIEWQLQHRVTGGVSSALVQGQRIFLSAQWGIHALEKNTGRLLWRNPNIENCYTMIAVGNSIYLIGNVKGEGYERAKLIALNQNNGELRWALPLTNSNRSLIYQSGRIFLEGRTGVLIVADSASVRP